MAAETMKMPEPIIEPATIIVESQRPRPLMKPVRLSSTSTPAPIASAMIILSPRVNSPRASSASRQVEIPNCVTLSRWDKGQGARALYRFQPTCRELKTPSPIYRRHTNGKNLIYSRAKFLREVNHGREQEFRRDSASAFGAHGRRGL